MSARRKKLQNRIYRQRADVRAVEEEVDDLFQIESMYGPGVFYVGENGVAHQPLRELRQEADRRDDEVGEKMRQTVEQTLAIKDRRDGFSIVVTLVDEEAPLRMVVSRSGDGAQWTTFTKLTWED
jgi:hypothetical protein